MQDAQNLVQAAKALLANEGFKTDFKATKVPKSRRNFIQIYSIRMNMFARVDKIADRESIRLLLEHWLNAGDCNVDTPMEPSYNLDQMLEAYHTTPATPTTPTPATPTTTTPSHNPTPTTITMSKAITITTQVNVNGVNADNYTDAQLFDMIRQQETEIKNLQALTNKPQSLLREIDTRQAGIDALVSFMNERDAKLNPQPAKPAKPAKPTGPGLQTQPWGCN